MYFNLTDALFGLFGGLMIGLSAAILLLANGRIAGISGIAGSLLRLDGADGTTERATFVIGLVG
ncbi:MAG: YeeE/YedE family protein, partial [Pseudomonadota bacterium]